MNKIRPQTRPALWALVAVITVACYAADFLSKEWALRTLADGAYRPLLGDYFGFQLVFNPGAAFSFLTNATWVFTIISVGVAIILVLLSRRLGSWPWALVIASLLGGTLGNLTDRLMREPGFAVGHVVDFLNYGGFFVGNVADIFIVLAALGIALLAFRGVPLAPVGAASNDGEAQAPAADGGAAEPEAAADPELDAGPSRDANE